MTASFFYPGPPCVKLINFLLLLRADRLTGALLVCGLPDLVSDGWLVLSKDWLMTF